MQFQTFVIPVSISARYIDFHNHQLVLRLKLFHTVNQELDNYVILHKSITASASSKYVETYRTIGIAQRKTVCLLGLRCL